MSLAPTLVGFLAGAMIGATGVGAGSLMTPLLAGAFGLPLPLAIGTDLWFAALTKAGGAVAHARQGHVEWRVAGLLLAGSMPAALATLLVMHATGIGRHRPAALGAALGVALLLTALIVVARGRWIALARRVAVPRPAAGVATVLLGVALGVLVTLSSVGAGAIGATVVLFLHPHLSGRRLVGTDIAHAVPLTLVAGIGHATLGNVDWGLLAMLLLGSLPGIWLGSRLVGRLPEAATRYSLSAALAVAGLRILA